MTHLPLAALGSLPAATGPLALGSLLIGFFGGLALFLYGMDELARSLKAVAGERLRGLLAAVTNHPLAGVLIGTVVTAMVQSSSVTTVLVVGFITAGLMTLRQSIGVILGANIGSTITAQLIAFRVTEYALVPVAAGFALLFFGRRERLRLQGTALLGLGLLFFGLSIMGDAMSPLRSFTPFLRLMEHLQRPLLGILAGAAFTGLVQSSAATAGLVIALAGQGLLSLPAGIAIVLGANVGTCVTALLASIGKPREAVRASLAHTLFNLLGVVLWFPFLDQLAAIAIWMSPQEPPGVEGLARLAAVTPRQIANAHTAFNVLNALLFMGGAGRFARWVERLVPDPDRATPRDAAEPRFLDEDLLSTPALALDRVRRELARLGSLTREMLVEALPACLSGGVEALHALARRDEPIDRLHGSIVAHLGRLSTRALPEEQSRELVRLLEVANDLENIGDILETNLVSLGVRRVEQGVTVSDATRRVLQGFHETVLQALDTALESVVERSSVAAETVVAMKPLVQRQASSAALHEAARLVAQEPNRLAAYTFETDVLENLKRVYTFCKRMARSALPR